MARINIEDQLFTDGRFIQLSTKHGIVKAVGMMVMAYRLAQTYWLKNKSNIPQDIFMFNESFEDIISVGLAEKINDEIYVCGSKEQFDWVLVRIQNGKKGGRPKTKTKPKNNLNETKEEPNVNLSEPKHNPQSQSQSQSQSLNIIPPNPQTGGTGAFVVRCNDIAKVWNDYAEDYKLTKIKTPISKDRMDRMRAALKEFAEIDDWSKIICAIGYNPFNLGSGPDGWKANFDWLFHKTKFNYRKMWELYESTNGENDRSKQARTQSSEDGDAFPF